jgi:hypothetical protein
VGAFSSVKQSELKRFEPDEKTNGTTSQVGKEEPESNTKN